MDNFHKYTVFFFFISGKSDNFAGLQFYAVGRRRSLTSRNSGQNIRGMVSIFYRSSGKIVYSQSMSDLTVLKHEDVIWIDLFRLQVMKSVRPRLFWIRKSRAVPRQRRLRVHHVSRKRILRFCKHQLPYPWAGGVCDGGRVIHFGRECPYYIEGCAAPKFHGTSEEDAGGPETFP